MGRKLDNVVSLYLDGVVDGHVLPAADKYLAEDFVDHTAGTEPGRQGFLDRYEPLVSRYRDRAVWPLRGFEDGSKVFLHTYQTYGRGQLSMVGMDVFDTDPDDCLTARWSITVPLVSPTRSGRSQIDGPTFGEPDGTVEHKRRVRSYVRDVLVEGRWDRMDGYLDRDYAEHSPYTADGPAGLARRLVELGDAWCYRTMTLLVGRGNYVATLGEATLLDEAYRVFDLYRLVDGRIVERWDAVDLAV
jgi:predicted SnoaL-like aldol condensation-catalyzing enzyme